MTIEIVFETHSLTTNNEVGIATGWLPGKLSEQGREFARELGRRRRNDGIDAAFVSDLARAVETAEIALGDGGIPMQQDSRLRECNYGELNGARSSELNRMGHIDERFSGGQSYRDVVEQMRDFLRDLARDHDEQRILLISHSANRWALNHLLYGVPLEKLVDAPFKWQPGWEYQLPSGWGK
jgi:broad specificity phosphatase PhoE